MAGWDAWRDGMHGWRDAWREGCMAGGMHGGMDAWRE